MKRIHIYNLFYKRSMASESENQITDWVYFHLFTFRWGSPKNVCYSIYTGVGWLPFSQLDAMCDISYVTFMSKSSRVAHSISNKWNHVGSLIFMQFLLVPDFLWFFEIQFFFRFFALTVPLSSLNLFRFFSPSLYFCSYPSVTVLYLFLLLPPAFLHSVCSHSTISVPWLFVYILFIVQHEHQQKKKLDIFRFPWHSCGLHGKVTLHVNIFRSNWNEPNKYVYKVTFGKCTIVFCTWGFVDFIPFFLSFSHFFSCAPLFAHFLFCSYPVSPVPENESQI